MASDRRSADAGDEDVSVVKVKEPPLLRVRGGGGGGGGCGFVFVSSAKIRRSVGRDKGPRLPGRRGAGGGGGRRRDARRRLERVCRNLAKSRGFVFFPARDASVCVSKCRRATHHGCGARAHTVGDAQRDRRRQDQQRRRDSKRQALHFRGFDIDTAKRLFLPREIPARHRCARPPVARAVQRERARRGVRVRHGRECREGAEHAREWEQGHERRGSGGSNLALSRQLHESSVLSKRGFKVRLLRGP